MVREMKLSCGSAESPSEMSFNMYFCPNFKDVTTQNLSYISLKKKILCLVFFIGYNARRLEDTSTVTGHM